jgi:dTDP-4-amino-4,6-dideoxygalactose transaminase
VFADIHPQTFCIDPADAARKITPRTKAILPVHLFGQAAPIEKLLALAEPKGIAVVEDCAQAIGACRGGKSVGGFGRMGCFSFYPTKNLGADGDGGMIVTQDEALAKKLKMLRVHGIERRYHHDLHGYNSRLDELQAAILRVKLRHLPSWNERRAAIAARYTHGLAVMPLECPVTDTGNQHVFHVYAVLTDQRDELQAHLNQHGVSTIIYYPLPLHLQKVYADLGYREGDLPVSEAVSRRILPLPIFPELTDEQADYVTATIRGFFTGFGS